MILRYLVVACIMFGVAAGAWLSWWWVALAGALAVVAFALLIWPVKVEVGLWLSEYEHQSALKHLRHQDVCNYVQTEQITIYVPRSYRPKGCTRVCMSLLDTSPNDILTHMSRSSVDKKVVYARLRPPSAEAFRKMIRREDARWFRPDAFGYKPVLVTKDAIHWQPIRPKRLTRFGMATLSKGVIVFGSDPTSTTASVGLARIVIDPLVEGCYVTNRLDFEGSTDPQRPVLIIAPSLELLRSAILPRGVVDMIPVAYGHPGVLCPMCARPNTSCKC